MDNDIKKILNSRVENINMPDLLPHIKREVTERKISMKKIKIMPKVILTAVVATIILASVAVAGGKVVSWHSSSSHKNDIFNFEELENISDKTGYDAKIIKNLGNYEFEVANVGDGKNCDDNGNVLNEYKNLFISYKTTNESANLSLNINPYFNEEFDGETISYNGKTLYYTAFTYMAVPPDYIPTEKEKELEEKGELQIGYGASELSKTFTQSIIWEDNNLSYNLLDMGENIDKNEFINMAKSVIDVK